MIFNKVAEILAFQLDIDKDSIQLESLLQEDLGADSISMVELILEIEEEFYIEVDETDIEGIRTVEDVVNYIEAKQKESDMDNEE